MKKIIFLSLSLMLVLTTGLQPVPYDALLMPTMILTGISISSMTMGKIVDYMQKPIDPNQSFLGIPEIQKSESALVNTLYGISFISAIGMMVLGCEP